MMPDPLHWLGVTKIHRFISMSDMKYDAIVSTVSVAPRPLYVVPRRLSYHVVGVEAVRLCGAQSKLVSVWRWLARQMPADIA